MFKNILISQLLIWTCTNAMAQSNFEGVYGQLGLGYESVSVKFTGGRTEDGFVYNGSGDNSNSFSGVIGVGGYFPLTTTFLMGVGVEYNPIPSSSSNVTISVPSVNFSETTKYKKKSSYNVFLSPAIAIEKDKLAYAKIGYTGLGIEVEGDKENYKGYSLGLGYKQIINGGLFGFGEVNYSAYSSKSDGDGLTGSNKPKVMNVMVGLGYKF